MRTHNESEIIRIQNLVKKNSETLKKMNDD